MPVACKYAEVEGLQLRSAWPLETPLLGDSMTPLEQVLAQYVTRQKREDARALVAILDKAREAPGSGCWIWTGSKGEDGYGSVRYRRKVWRAHRAAYTILVGPIPFGLELDHLCRVRACVNPSHLEPVTGEENIRRFQAALSVEPLGGDIATETLAAVIAVMVAQGVDRLHTVDILASLAERDPGAYGDWDGGRLAAVLAQAGARRRTAQINIRGVNRTGWRLVDLLARQS